MDLYRLSQLKGKSFSRAVNEVYEITDFNNSQYPNYLNWYYNKNIPRVLNGTGDVLFNTEGFMLKGLIAIKNECEEKKICTLIVDKPYRNNKIGTKLLEEAFEILGTSKPVITIPEFKIEQFQYIINKYDWKETDKIYSYNSLEIKFN